MRVVLSAMVVAAALAGCGGGTSDQTAAPSTPAPAPSAATETPTAPPSATASATPTPTTQPLPSVSPEDEPGGAGDETPIRVPVEFTVSDGGISPNQIAIPAFFVMELIVHNKTSQQVVVRLAGAHPITVAAGETSHALLEGRKKGSYVVDAGTAGQAVVVTGAKPGP